MNYLEQRRTLKCGIKTTEAPEQENKYERKERGDFFSRMIKKAPAKCQESGQRLAGTMAINPAAVVCHILPKRKQGGVPSMATNPLNIVYLHGDVHQDFDNKGQDYVRGMKIYPLMLKRVALMWPYIPLEERKNVPSYLQPNNLLP